MKTLIAVSDTHGHKENLNALSQIFEECDYIVHLGDGRADMREISEKYPEKTYVLKGNCDLCGGLKEAEIQIEGVKIFACHGDLYRVKSEPFTLAEEAKRRGASVALYGHTHRAAVHRADGCTRTVIPDWDMQGKGPRHRGWVELNSCGLPQIVLTDRWV